MIPLWKSMIGPAHTLIRTELMTILAHAKARPMPKNLSKQSHKAWIDVTGIVRWGAQPPTGVQRVETAICKHAFDNDLAGFVILDAMNGRYRQLSRSESAFLKYILAAQWPGDMAPYLQRVCASFAFLGVQLSHQDNETARRLAFAATGYRRRAGFSYTLVKSLIRPVQWGWLAARLAGIWSKIGVRKLLGLSEQWASEGSVVLVSHEINRHMLITSALERAGLSGVHIVHDLIPVLKTELTSGRFSRGMEGFFRRILNAPEPIIAVSQATRDDLVAWNRDVVGAPYPFEIKVCPLGAALVSAGRETEPVPGLADRRFAVFCSTFDIRKNQHLLVAVWAWLARNMAPERLPDLLLVGRRGNSSGLVQEELAKAPELAGRVHILSGISDRQLRWAYRNAHLGLFPSSAEGWGLGVSECMANGLPVVHADVPALKEAAQKLMPVLPAGDFDAWAATLKDLFEHPEKIDALRDLVVERYDHGTPEGFAGCVISYLQALADTGLEAARKDGGQA